MLFGWDGRAFNTDEMISVLSREFEWGLYITRDHSCVFGTYYVPVEGITVRPLGEEELEKLAREEGHPDIRKAWEKFLEGRSCVKS